MVLNLLRLMWRNMPLFICIALAVLIFYAARVLFVGCTLLGSVVALIQVYKFFEAMEERRYNDVPPPMLMDDYLKAIHRYREEETPPVATAAEDTTDDFDKVSAAKKIQIMKRVEAQNKDLVLEIKN